MSEADTLPGLFTASYRGQEFFVPDTSSAPGRRTLEYLYPGIDRPDYDDFGLLPADIYVDALVIGDDYIAQAKALEAAFNTPGPGTLIHPWLGAMTVMMLEPAEILFSARELGAARVSATFRRIDAGAAIAASIVSTAATLIAAASSVGDAASALAAAPEDATISAVQSLAAGRSARVAGAVWTGLQSGAAASAIAAVAA